MRHHYEIVFTFGGTAFLLLAGLVGAQTAASSQKAPAKSTAQVPAKPAAVKSAPLEVPQLKFEKYKLENGLEVILSEDHRLPMVAVNLWYHVGPANELPGRTGFAHLFEHMMFEGSRHVPGSWKTFGISSNCITRRTMRAWRSWGILIRRRRANWCRNILGR